MTESKTTLLIVREISKSLIAFACVAGLGFGMLLGIKYLNAHAAAKPSVEYNMQQQAKACHAECVARYEVER